MAGEKTTRFVLGCVSYVERERCTNTISVSMSIQLRRTYTEAALALSRTGSSSIWSTLPVLTRRSPADRGERARLSCMQPIVTAVTAVSDATIPKAIVRISLTPREEKDEVLAVPVVSGTKVAAVGTVVTVRLVAVEMIILVQMHLG